MLQKNLILSLCFLIALHNCHSQTVFEIKGKIVDEESEDILPFASMNILNKTLGTLSNSNGEFELKIVNPNQNDTLVFYYLGYETLKKSLTECNIPNLKISLKKKVLNLETIVVFGLSAEEILKSAILKIPDNYANNFTWLQGFYRQTIKEDSSITELSEMVIKIKKYPSSIRKVDSCELIKGRYSKQKDGSLGYSNGLTNLLKKDIIQYPMDFFTIKNFKNYNYDIEATTFYNNSNVYIINFDQKDEIKEDLYKGKIFIDQNSLAVVRVEYTKSPKGQEYWKMSRKDAFFLKKISGCECSYSNMVRVITYKQINNKWYLNSIQSVSMSSINCNAKEKKPFVSDHKAELIITDVILNNVNNIDKTKLINPYLPLKLQITNNDPDFWNNYNILQLRSN